MPAPERLAPVPLQGLRQGFHDHSGTLFASHKLPLRAYLAAIAVFCNEVKGKSALAMSRDLGRLLQVLIRPAPQAPRGDG